MLSFTYIYLRGREYRLKNGKAISFWMDKWLEEEPLCKAYPILFDLAVNQRCSVYDVALAEWVIQFKIRPPPLIRNQWYELARKLNTVILSDTSDEASWKWSPSRKFTVKSTPDKR
jgi:hypothetical protein